MLPPGQKTPRFDPKDLAKKRAKAAKDVASFSMACRYGKRGTLNAQRIHFLCRAYR